MSPRKLLVSELCLSRTVASFDWVEYVVHFNVLTVDESPMLHCFDNCSGEVLGILLDSF